MLTRLVGHRVDMRGTVLGPALAWAGAGLRVVLHGREERQVQGTNTLRFPTANLRFSFRKNRSKMTSF